MTGQCVKCGICEAVCPSSLSALRAIDLDRVKKVSPEVVNCTTCNRCVASCPAGVPITKAIERLRGSIVTPGYSETLDTIFRYDSSVVPDIRPDVAPKPCKVAYFAGCLTNFRARRIAGAVTATLDYLGIEFTRIPEACCGSPLNRIGRFDLARKLLEKNLGQLRRLGVEAVVTSCPGCTSTLLEYQDEFEVAHYLDLYDKKKIYGALKRDGCRTSLQYPCHLYRNVSPYTMKVAEKIIRGMGDYVPLEEPGRCCGAGGGVRRNDIGLSRALRARKADDIRSVAPDVVAVVCPQCGIQLSESFPRVEDLAVLVARNLGLRPGG